jgi:hypothetical protein
MTQRERRTIETAAENSIAKMRAARSATKEAAAGIARGAAPAELQPLLDRVAATHEGALNATRDFANSLAAVKTIEASVQLAIARVEAARAAADQFRAAGAAATQAQANTTRDADDEAVDQLNDLKQSTLSDRSSWFTQFTSQQVLGLAAGFAVFVLAAIVLAALGFGIFGPQSLVDKLAKTENARGLITYILAVGTIAIAVVLVVGALLGGDEDKDSFSRGKEILTMLIGIFGTILGFYYGSEQKQTSSSPSPSPSPSALSSPDSSP